MLPSCALHFRSFSSFGFPLCITWNSLISISSDFVIVFSSVDGLHARLHIYCIFIRIIPLQISHFVPQRSILTCCSCAYFSRRQRLSCFSCFCRFLCVHVFIVPRLPGGSFSVCCARVSVLNSFQVNCPFGVFFCAVLFTCAETQLGEIGSTVLPSYPSDIASARASTFCCVFWQIKSSLCVCLQMSVCVVI